MGNVNRDGDVPVVACHGDGWQGLLPVCERACGTGLVNILVRLNRIPKRPDNRVQGFMWHAIKGAVTAVVLSSYS